MSAVEWGKAVRPSVKDLISGINKLESYTDVEHEVTGTFLTRETANGMGGLDGIAEVKVIKGNTEVVNGALLSSIVAGIESESVCEFPPQMLRGINTAQDTMTSEGIERVIGQVDLGTLTWSKSGVRFYTIIDVATSTIPIPAECANNELGNILCAKYETTTRTRIDTADDAISLHGSATLRYFNVVDSTYSTVEAFTAAMNGVIAYYELDTPEFEMFAEPLDPIIYNVETGGTETWIIPDGASPTSSAPTSTIKYKMQYDYELITERSFDNFCTALETALNLNIEKEWNNVSKEWEYTITV